CGTNGSASAVSVNQTLKTGSFTCAWSDDPAGAVDDVTINLSLGDGDGGSDSKTKTVTVSNVAPTLSAISGDATANEGDGPHTYTFSFTDPGDDVWSGSASCGTNGSASAVSANQTLKTGSFTCAWSDDPAGSNDDVTINLSLSDGDG